eukprot:1158774-Pelagomonas_calceolata.AAC.3
MADIIGVSAASGIEVGGLQWQRKAQTHRALPAQTPKAQTHEALPAQTQGLACADTSSAFVCNTTTIAPIDRCALHFWGAGAPVARLFIFCASPAAVS